MSAKCGQPHHVGPLWLNRVPQYKQTAAVSIARALRRPSKLKYCSNASNTVIMSSALPQEHIDKQRPPVQQA